MSHCGWRDREDFLTKLMVHLADLAVKNGALDNVAARDALEANKAVEKGEAIPMKQPLFLDASAQWKELFKEYYARFVPGKDDLEVLRQAHGCPSIWILETFASPEVRERNLPDPTAGLWHGAERETEESSEFSAYVRQFCSLATMLYELRKPWLEIASREDPMWWDEAEVRYVEGLILRDLVARQVPAKILREAHCLSRRKYDRNVSTEAPGYEKRGALSAALGQKEGLSWCLPTRTY